MEIIQKRISELVPYKNNTKKHDDVQIKNVAESIKQYGFVQPIVIDKNDVIVIGHCRYEASKLLGMKEVPCVLVDNLSEEQVKALRIVDNKTNESEWDMELLEEEIDSISLDDFDFNFNFPEDIDWDDGVGDLETSNYEEPTENLIRCPKCGHVDDKFRFMKASNEDISVSS